MSFLVEISYFDRATSQCKSEAPRLSHSLYRHVQNFVATIFVYTSSQWEPDIVSQHLGCTVHSLVLALANHVIVIYGIKQCMILHCNLVSVHIKCPFTFGLFTASIWKHENKCQNLALSGLPIWMLQYSATPF